MRAVQVFLLALVLLGSYSCNTIKTKEDIYGVWLYNTIKVKGELLFDRNDSTVYAERLMEMVEQFQVVDEEEREALAKKAADMQDMYSKIAYRFTADSVYILDQQGKPYIRGTYTFDKGEQEVVCMMNYSSMYSESHIQKVVFRIIGGRLVTHTESKDKGETTIQELVKEK